jgi:hypothetical protein
VTKYDTLFLVIVAWGSGFEKLGDRRSPERIVAGDEAKYVVSCYLGVEVNVEVLSG